MVRISKEEAQRLIEGYRRDMEALKSDPVAWDEELTTRTEWGVYLPDHFGLGACSINWKEQERLAEFGKWLRKARRRAGFRSLEQVVEAERKEVRPDEDRLLSKPELSLLERGKLESPTPQLLWQLGRLLRVPYWEMVRRWVVARFVVTFPGSVADSSVE